MYCDKELDEDFSYDEDRHYKIESFESFCHNEISLDNQPIKFMSERTACIIKNIDFTKEKILKRQIFNDIHTILHKFNNLKFELNDFDVPMIYPIISNQNAKIAKLLDMNNIYTIRYWTNFPESFFESYFQNQLLGIPLLEKSLNVLKVLD